MFLITLISTIDIINGDFFEKLVEEHKDRMMGIAMAYTRNKQDAEDVVQDTFLKIYRNIRKFNHLASKDMIPLIVICTERTAIDFLRKRKRQIPTSSLSYLDEEGDAGEYEIPDDEVSFDELLIDAEAKRFMGQCVDELPEEQRYIMQLKYEYELKDKDIANLMGITETAVSTKVWRIKKRLRMKMEEKYHE